MDKLGQCSGERRCLQWLLVGEELLSVLSWERLKVRKPRAAEER